MGNLNCYRAEDCRFDSFFGWLRATQHCACNKWLPTCRWLQSTVNLQSTVTCSPKTEPKVTVICSRKTEAKVVKKFKRKWSIPIHFCLSKNDNIQIHQFIEMSQDLNPNTCSCLVIFMYSYENHTFNATPTERFQQHPLVFAMNRNCCTFFLWRLHLAPPSHPGQNTTLLWLERPSSKCAKLPTVASSNNKYLTSCSSYFCMFAPRGCWSSCTSVRGESHIQHNANWEAATPAARLG